MTLIRYFLYNYESDECIVCIRKRWKVCRCNRYQVLMIILHWLTLGLTRDGTDPWWGWPMGLTCDGADPWWGWPVMGLTPDGADPWWGWPVMGLSRDGAVPWWDWPMMGLTTLVHKESEDYENFFVESQVDFVSWFNRGSPAICLRWPENAYHWLIPANTRLWQNGGLTFAHCLRHWPNVKPTLERPVFDLICHDC